MPLKSLLLILCFITSSAFSEIKPLFYKTINFAENDVLNVREKPNYRAKKMGEIGLGMQLERKQCTQTDNKKWCKVQSLNTGIEGWVNAKYISPTTYQEGYVTIRNRKSICDYVLRCESRNSKPQCLVVTDVSDNVKITLQTEWIDYQLLKPASNFSAADDKELNPEGGFCTRATYINAFFTNQKFKSLSKTFPQPEFQTVVALLRALSNSDENAIKALIHPKKGIRLSTLSYFDKNGSRRFSKASFLSDYKSRKVLNWGQTEAKGDTIKKDLYAYFEGLPKDIPHIAKVITLDDYKNFPRDKEQALKAYEVYWYQDEKNKEYAYMGLVIVLEAYKDQWAVVGITKDYWTP